MSTRTWLPTAFIVATGLFVAARGDVAVTVDRGVEHQTIDGLGGFGAMMPWWFSGPFYNDDFLDLLIDTLGLTIHRTELYPRPSQTENYTKQIPFLNALRQKAERSGEPLLFTASVWSPPGDMKSEGSTTGGYLLPEHYTAYADYLIQYIADFKEDVGADLYALSPQNEPGFCFPYNSSCSLPAEYSQEVIAVAKRFDEKAIGTKLHYADNVWWPGWLGQCVNVIKDDPVANKACPILSIHYSDGNEENNIAGNKYCSELLDKVGRETHKLWNTEFGGQFDSWREDLLGVDDKTHGGAWTFARNLFTCLRYDYSAVIYWQLCEPPHDNAKGDHYSLFYLKDNVPTPGPLFRVAQSFYRYIRPGAVRVDCESNNPDVWSIAFVHPEQQSATVVLMNRSSAEQTAVVTGAGLPDNFDMFRTSPNHDCEKIGSAALGSSITLPVKSITTLYHAPTVHTKPARGTQTVSSVRPVRRTRFQVYSLDGRRVGTVQRQATGVRFRRVGDGSVRHYIP